LSILLLSTVLAQVPAQSRYVVLVDPGPKEEFLPAAKSLAEFQKGRLLRFDPANLDAAFAELKKIQPDFVVFVLPPDEIDVDLSHQILERSTTLDDDPFCDFEYGFITGRDGAAALRFVERIKKAWKHSFGRKVAMFGSWEGKVLPPEQPLTALKAMKAEGVFRVVAIGDKEEQRHKAARQALAQCQGKDLLLFFSHGYPHEMAGCFRAQDLRKWQVDLSGTILINCACYNGAPGRWFAPGGQGVEDKGLVKLQDAVALQILDSGVVGYFGGIDPWHGPLALQLTSYVFDDGLRLGQAARRMHDRLALEFLPDRIHFPPTLQNPKRFAGEGTINRRHNGAGMIFYGDPALAPFAQNASKLRFASLKKGAGHQFTITLGHRPLVDGTPAEDYMIPQSGLMDYYSVKTADFLKELSLEVYRVVPLPPGVDKVLSLKVKSARSGKNDVPTKAPQFVVEKTRNGNFLHVRVPLDVRVLGSVWPATISLTGIRIELEGAFGGASR
jgi:hypothetical protein